MNKIFLCSLLFLFAITGCDSMFDDELPPHDLVGENAITNETSATVDKTKIFGNISVFASANNVYTFTSYPGPSPESWSSDAIQGASVDTEAYPKTRTFNFGVKVTIK